MCPLRSRSGSKGIGSNPEKASRHNGSMQSAEAAPTPPACSWNSDFCTLQSSFCNCRKASDFPQIDYLRLTSTIIMAKIGMWELCSVFEGCCVGGV